MACGELSGNNCFERLGFDAEHLQRGAKCRGVRGEFIALGQFLHRHRAQLHVGSRCARFEFVAIVKHARSSLHQTEMPVQGVLVERNQHIHLVPHAANRSVARADGQKRVAAADNRLIGVVSIQVQPAARKNARENVARAGDALSILTADADCKINCSHRKNQMSACRGNPQGVSFKPFLKRAELQAKSLSRAPSQFLRN